MGLGCRTHGTGISHVERQELKLPEDLCKCPLYPTVETDKGNALKVLVTGAAGVVGGDLCPVLEAVGFDIVQTDIRWNKEIQRLDVRDVEEVTSVIRIEHPGLVIHLAAETDVDRCETEVDHAYRTNTLGTWNVALACQQEDAAMVYVSTAGVFDRNEDWTLHRV